MGDLLPRERVRITQGKTYKYKMACGNLYVTVNEDEEGICEVFTALGRAGGCPSQSEAVSRTISAALRAGVSVESLVEQLQGIRCHACLRLIGKHGREHIDGLSCPDIISKAIRNFMNEKAGVQIQAVPVDEETSESEISCPECGTEMTMESGCRTCHSCGFSECG